MQSTPEIAPKPKIEIPAPPFVQFTATLVMLYSFVTLIVLFVFAFLTHKWALILGGFFQFSLYFSLASGIFQLKKWTWWVCVLGGSFFIVRFFVGILVGGMRWALHQPQQPLFLTVFIIGIIFFVPIVIRMLMRESRLAFGISK